MGVTRRLIIIAILPSRRDDKQEQQEPVIKIWHNFLRGAMHELNSQMSCCMNVLRPVLLFQHIYYGT